jgi:hypothetical protein
LGPTYFKLKNAGRTPPTTPDFENVEKVFGPKSKSRLPHVKCQLWVHLTSNAGRTPPPTPDFEKPDESHAGDRSSAPVPDFEISHLDVVALF